MNAPGPRHISEFIPRPENVLAIGDIWDTLTKEARYWLLTMGGQLGVIGPSIPWADIPATFRLELVARVYFLRDFLNKVLP